MNLEVNRQLKQGLYVITDPSLTPGEQLPQAVMQALQGGACMVQYRDKSDNHSLRLQQASRLLELCRQFQVPLIINDDIELAMEIKADGIHLGKNDDDYKVARQRLGNETIIGISCYNDLERARHFAAMGADYVAFGRFYPSSTKPKAEEANPALLREARAELQLPVVAIGGITGDNGAPLVEAGADLLAVIHGVFGQTDIRGAAESICNLYPPSSQDCDAHNSKQEAI